MKFPLRSRKLCNRLMVDYCYICCRVARINCISYNKCLISTLFYYGMGKMKNTLLSLLVMLLLALVPFEGRAGEPSAQLVLDLAGARHNRCFELAATGGKSHRIVVDVYGRGEDPVEPPAAQPARPFTVVIDPGHGGDDPGAMRGG